MPGAASEQAVLNATINWKTAELTTWDPTGMRSIATTKGTSNPYYEKLWIGYASVGHSGGAARQR
jgi:hypothetical protein